MKLEITNYPQFYQILDSINTDAIQYFDNFIDQKTCNECIDLLDTNESQGNCQEGELGFGTIDKNRKNAVNLSFNDNNKKLKALSDIIAPNLGIFIRHYLMNLGYFGSQYIELNDTELKKSLPRLPESMQIRQMGIRKYPKNEGGYFMPHYDNQGYHQRFRVVAVILYLNDIKYGGETIFPLLKRRIQPKAGRLALFPPYYTHLHYGNSSPEDKYTIVAHIVDDPTKELDEYYSKIKEKKNGKK